MLSVEENAFLALQRPGKFSTHVGYFARKIQMEVLPRIPGRRNFISRVQEHLQQRSDVLRVLRDAGLSLKTPKVRDFLKIRGLRMLCYPVWTTGNGVEKQGRNRRVQSATNADGTEIVFGHV